MSILGSIMITVLITIFGRQRTDQSVSKNTLLENAGKDIAQMRLEILLNAYVFSTTLFHPPKGDMILTVRRGSPWRSTLKGLWLPCLSHSDCDYYPSGFLGSVLPIIIPCSFQGKVLKGKGAQRRIFPSCQLGSEPFTCPRIYRRDRPLIIPGSFPGIIILSSFLRTVPAHVRATHESPALMSIKRDNNSKPKGENNTMPNTNNLKPFKKNDPHIKEAPSNDLDIVV